MSNSYVLSLDMGTSSLKCLIAGMDGSVKALTRKKVTYFSPEGLAPMGKEFSPDEVWQSMCQLSREALHEAGLEGEDIAAVSATSQRGGMVLIDENGRELYAGPNHDVRAFFEGMSIDEVNGKDIYSLTGHLPSFLFAGAKLNWFQEHRPEINDRIHKALPVNDWLTFKLSGQLIAERSSLGESGLLNIRTGGLDHSLLGTLGISPDVLPPVGQAGDTVGEITSQVSTVTGLEEGTPVALGGSDTQCGLLGMGVIEEGHLGVIAGWSAPLQLVTGSPVFDPEMRTWTGCHVVPNRWVLESSTTQAGQSLDWLSDILGEGYGNHREEPCSSISDSSLVNGEQAVAFLGPRIMNCSKMGLQLGGVLFPVPVGHTNMDGHHIRQAALENLAFAIMENYLQLKEVSKLDISEVRLGGGVSNISDFPQLVCDSLSMELKVPHVKDVSLLGVAMCAAVGAGEYANLSEAADVMKTSFAKLEPDESKAFDLEERHARWLSIYQLLEGLSEEL